MIDLKRYRFFLSLSRSEEFVFEFLTDTAYTSSIRHHRTSMPTLHGFSIADPRLGRRPAFSGPAQRWLWVGDHPGSRTQTQKHIKRNFFSVFVYQRKKITFRTRHHNRSLSSHTLL
jgi:hypothetical protein